MPTRVRVFPYAWLRTTRGSTTVTSNTKGYPMSTTTENPAAVAGIDSHKDTLAACVIDQTGRPVEHQTFPNTPQGHRKAIGWLQRRNTARVGIEGTGKLRTAPGAAARRPGRQHGRGPARR